jgi:hypothetical protein
VFASGDRDDQLDRRGGACVSEKSGALVGGPDGAVAVSVGKAALWLLSFHPSWYLLPGFE